MANWPPEEGECTQLFCDELFTTGLLTLEDRKWIVDQAILLMEQVYVNRTIKRALHGVDPVLRLWTLRRHLDGLLQEDLERVEEFGLGFSTLKRSKAPEIEFHREMTSIFASLRDRHTHYHLPEPFKKMVAFLPFDVETVLDDDGIERYILARVRSENFVAESLLPRLPRWDLGMGDFGADAPIDQIVEPEPGWRVVMWNNKPIEEAAKQLAAEHAGSNPAAQIAQGLARLTLRPLIVAAIPDEPWVSVTFSDSDGRYVEIDFQWLVMTTKTFKQGEKEASAPAVAPECGTDFEQEAASVFRGQVDAGGSGEEFENKVSASVVRYHNRDFGYIRIHSFASERKEFAEEFVEKFAKLLTDEMPENGLIIDLRGNGGGVISAAESILQLLTPRRIEPEPFQFLVSPLIQKLTQHADPQRFPLQPDLSKWRDSVALGARTGTAFSRGVPITTPEQCNDRGQVYYGPSVLIVDANCYSATDMFIAGYRDHQIGPLVGTDENTGAGGANVWTYSHLGRVLRGTEAETRESFPAPPDETRPDFGVAIRRSLRVGANAGTPLEDLGVVPDYRYRFTATDVLERNRNLLEAASELLVHHVIPPPKAVQHGEATRPPRLCKLREVDEPEWPEPKARKLTLEVSEAGPPTLRGTVSTRGIGRLDVYVDGRPETTIDIEETPTVFEVPRRSDGEIVLELKGYERQKASNEWRLVAAKREPIAGA